jgi:hypothetical protein
MSDIEDHIAFAFSLHLIIPHCAYFPRWSDIWTIIIEPTIVDPHSNLERRGGLSANS